ncbi:MAG: hypothetical protein ACE5I9_12620 [Candidatus Methylomirabilales bacterium]
MSEEQDLVLHWEEVGQFGARYFRASISGGSLIASVFAGTEKAGLGLAFAPA